MITDNGSNLVSSFKSLTTKQLISKSIHQVIDEVIKNSFQIDTENDTENDTKNDTENEAEEINWQNEYRKIDNEINEFETNENEEGNIFNQMQRNIRIPCYAHTLQMVVNQCDRGFCEGEQFIR